MNLTQLLTQAAELDKKATPGRWVLCGYQIFESDRPSQKRNEPYWTLVKGDECIAAGKIGDKFVDIPKVISPTGYEADGLHIKKADMDFVTFARNNLATLVRIVEVQREALLEISRYGHVKADWSATTDQALRQCEQIAQGDETT